MFFFFQAEYGIRVDLVTGVQTCALPISRARRARVRVAPRARRAPPRRGRVAARCLAEPELPRLRRRSEERRVGKVGWLGGAQGLHTNVYLINKLLQR